MNVLWGDFYAEDSKGGHSSCGIRHAVFAGDEGDAEGDAADCRQADHPVHRRGGARERHRGDPHRQRPRQARHRGSLRLGADA